MQWIYYQYLIDNLGLRTLRQWIHYHYLIDNLGLRPMMQGIYYQTNLTLHKQSIHCCPGVK